MRIVAFIFSALTAAMVLVGTVLAIASNDMQTIIVGDVLVLGGCLTALPVLHYWIDPR